MSKFNDADDPQRRKLIQALSLGVFSSTIPLSNTHAWNLFGNTPKKLPQGKSIYRLEGDVSVNGNQANLNSMIKPGDKIVTGEDSEVIFAVGGHSMILRSDTELILEGQQDNSDSWFINGLRLITGKILSVSRNTPMQLKTSPATIGIRGTGWYAEADPEKTYFCTCYGTTDISANKDNEKLTVSAKHHDQPIYILGENEKGKSIRKAPFINHTDQELMLIETLVGRTPPFVFPKDDYSGPRRDY